MISNGLSQWGRKTYLQRTICKEAYVTTNILTMSPSGSPSDPEPREAPRPEQGQVPEATIELTASNLRGIAHPVRVRMLGLLRAGGPATATTLARRLGLNTGATSYHLRQLAAHGFVVEDPALGSGRERWWRAAHWMTRLDRTLLDTEESNFGWAYLRSVAELYSAQMFQAVDELSGVSPGWRRATTFSDHQLLLTPEELQQLTGEVAEVLRRYRVGTPDAERSAPPGAAVVTFQLQAFPRPGSSEQGDQ